MPKKPKPTKSLPKIITTINICMVIIVTIAYTTFTIITYSVPPLTYAEQKFRKMAASYYETSYYPELKSSLKDTPIDTTLSQYAEHGFPPITLRELLNYAPQYKKAFIINSYPCDETKSQVTITPTPPYTPTDYTLTLSLSCDE
jgi:hypothetical protein